VTDPTRAGAVGGTSRDEEGSQDRLVDLHTHSTASDGARAPAEVIRAAAAAGLGAVALTDHDTLDGVPEAIATGREVGLRVVAGVELSAVEPEGETHILGLHLSDSSSLEQRLVQLRDMRVQRAARIVERLNGLGIPVALERVFAAAAGGAVGRPHVARALVEGGWVSDLREAFDRFLGNGKSAFVPKEQLLIRDAIALIHHAGGLAVLAHPGSACTPERVAALAAAGLDGIEVLHPSHSWEDSQRLDAMADQFGLVRSGGSDWHGAPDGTRTLGMMRVPAQWLRDQDVRATERATRRVA